MSKYHFLQFLVFLVFVLLFVGGLVTSTDSGLSVPDWPLSYGKLMPPMVGGIRYEHTHRMIASTVGLLVLILTFWIGKTESRKEIRWLSIAALGAVVSQGILGGLTVLYYLPDPISITHACLGPLFFCIIVSLTLLHSPKFAEASTAFVSLETRDAFRHTAFLTTLLAFVQLLLGAVVRHTGQGVLFHICSAFFILMMIGLLINRSMSSLTPENPLRKICFFLGFLVILEFFLGIGTFIFTQSGVASSGLGPILFPTFHQTLGSLILVTALTITLKSYGVGLKEEMIRP